MIAIFERNTKEYKALEAAAAMLTALSPRETVYKVEETYFDLGQNWKWTTVIAHRKDGGSWQALSPREQDLITDEVSIENIAKAVEMVKNDIFNPDK